MLVNLEKSTRRKEKVAAINLDDAQAGMAVRESSEGDPVQAIPCVHCGTWFSVAHRLSAERMPCPRCDRQNTIPELLTSSSADGL